MNATQGEMLKSSNSVALDHIYPVELPGRVSHVLLLFFYMII